MPPRKKTAVPDTPDTLDTPVPDTLDTPVPDTLEVISNVNGKKFTVSREYYLANQGKLARA